MSLLQALNLPPAKGGAIQPTPIVGITETQGHEVSRNGARPIAVAASPPAALATRLEHRDQTLREAYRKLAQAQTTLEQRVSSTTGSTKATAEAQKRDVDKAMAGVERQLGQNDADRTALASPATDAKAMNDILVRSTAPIGANKAVEVDRHDDPVEKTSPLKKQTTTTTTSLEDGKSTTQVHDVGRSVGLGGAKQTTVDSTETVTADGRTAKSTTTASKVGADGYSREKTTTTENERAGKKTSSEDKRSVQVGPGGASASRETKATATDGSSTSRKTSVGAERADGKAGVNASTTRTNTNDAGGSTTLGGSGRGGLQSKDGAVGGYGEGQGSVEKKGANGLSAGAVAGLNANISCNVKPIADGYVLETRINLGASLKLSTGGEKKDEGKGSGKVGASVSGSATVYMTCAHTLSEAEAQAYVAGLKTGGGQLPEFAIIRTGLSKGWQDAQRMYLAMTGKAGSAADLDTMKAGDSKTVGRKTSEGAGVNAESGPIGINAEAERSQERETTVTKNKDGSVTYDNKQGQGDSKSAGGSVNVGVASAGMTIGKTITTSTGFKLTVPPGTKNARELQDGIAALANASVGEIEAFIKAHPVVKVARTDVRDQGNSTKVTAGVAGVKATFLDGAGIEDSTTTDREGNITGHSKRGHNEGGLSVAAAGKQVGTEIKEEAVGHDDDDGERRFDVRRSQADTDVVGLLDSLPIVGSKKKDRSALQKATGAQEEPEAIREVAGITMAAGDLKAIAALAHDTHRWNDPVSSPRDMDDWSKAAAAIRKGKGDPKAVEEALATFVGSNSMRKQVVTRLLRPVGDVSSASRWEFPNSIGKLQGEFKDLVTTACEKQVASAAEKDPAKAKTFGQSLVGRLQSLSNGVKSASDFKDKAVQQEMLTAIANRQRQVELAVRKVDGADEATAEKGQERADFQRALELCIGYQQTETDYFKQIEAKADDPTEVMRLTVEIKNLQALWTPQYNRAATLAQENGWGKDSYWKYRPDTQRLAGAVKTGKAGEATGATPETTDKRRDEAKAKADPNFVSQNHTAQASRQADDTTYQRFQKIKKAVPYARQSVMDLSKVVDTLLGKHPNVPAEKLFKNAYSLFEAADMKINQCRPNVMQDMFDLGDAGLIQYQEALAQLKKARAMLPK